MLPDGTSRDIDVFISSGPIFASPTGHWDEWGFTEALRFIAPDPTFYNPTLQTVTWSLDPGQTELEFPITFPIEFTFTGIDQTNSVSYTGTWPSFPGIVITGPLYGFKIENTDTQEIIELNHVIDAGEVVTITLDYGNKTVVSSTLGNIIGTVTLDSDLATFHIAPDPQAASGTNHFHLTGTGADANTQVVLSYYTRYIGI